MKKNNKVDQIYSNAASKIIKVFVSPSLLVYFLSKTAQLVYEYSKKDSGIAYLHSTHNITMVLLSDLAEPWIDNNLWDLENNLRYFNKNIGCARLNRWVTEVVYITSKAEIEGMNGAPTVSEWMDFYTCFYEVAESLQEADYWDTETQKQAA